MISRQEKLEESIETWQENAKSANEQLLGAIGLFGCGVGASAVGIIGLVNRAPVVGVPSLAIGIPMAVHGFNSIKAEVADLVSMQSKVAVREHELARLEDQPQ